MSQRRHGSSAKDEIRRKVDAKLGNRPVNDFEWASLQLQVFEVQMDALTIDELVAEIQEARQRVEAPVKLGRTHKKPDVRHSPLGLREEVLAAIVAKNAAMHQRVQQLRTQVLNNQLLEDDQVLAWLKAQEEKEGHPDLWLTNSVVPASSILAVLAALEKRYDDLPHDAEGNLLPLSLTVTIDPRHIKPNLSPRYLDCIVRDPETGQYETYTCNTKAGGVLEALRRTGEHLARVCSWVESDAVRFILTGIPPAVPRISSSVSYSSWKMRIHLTIDPDATPREVMEYYRAEREPMISRTRALTEKHLRLVLFTIRQPRTDGETWREYMIRWNQTYRKQHPDWTYTQDTNFARDCTQAREHLEHPDYRVPVSPEFARWLESQRAARELEEASQEQGST